jgi:hypothetical protein
MAEMTIIPLFPPKISGQPLLNAFDQSEFDVVHLPTVADSVRGPIFAERVALG